MGAKYKYYRFHDEPTLKNNINSAIKLFKSEFEESNENRIELFPDTSGIGVYENEVDIAIQTRKNFEYHLEMTEPVIQEYLVGHRHLERYSYFKLKVNKFDGKGKNIIVNVNLDSGEKFRESIIRNKGWDNYQRYISYIIYGLKQKCIELKIADLNFEIVDLEYNLNTSCHTSEHAAKYFIDKYIIPKLKNKASK